MGLSEIQAAVIDGKTYCTFVREGYTEISGNVYDLNNNRFHLMLATGPVSASECLPLRVRPDLCVVVYIHYYHLFFIVLFFHAL